MKTYFKEKFNIDIKESFINILGPLNKNIMDDFKGNKNVGVIINEELNFCYKETVMEEINYGLSLSNYRETNIDAEDNIRLLNMESVLNRKIYTLGVSDKIKLKFLSSIMSTGKYIVFYNVFELLDEIDKRLVLNVMKKYSKEIVFINLTNNIEDVIVSDRVIIFNEEKMIVDGSPNQVLKEEKILRRLGYGLPFIVELNTYCKDYDLITEHIYSMEKLVDELCK